MKVEDKIAQELDSENLFSIDELIAKFRRRLPILLVCMVVVPLIALLIRFVIPVNYKSSAQVLIRHGSGNKAFFQDSISDYQLVSGESAAEIIRSIPVVSQMADDVDMIESDVARPAYKVIIGYFMTVAYWFLPDEEGPSSEKERYQIMAKDIKDTLETATLQQSTTSFTKDDEVVEIIFYSTNRDKVATMVNRLCQVFIEQMNRKYAKDARNVNRILTEQSKQIRKDISRQRDLLQDPNFSIDYQPVDSEWPSYTEQTGVSASNSPASFMSRDVAKLQLDLIATEEIFNDSAQEVISAREELASALNVLSKLKAYEEAKSILGSYQEKRRQALLAEKLFESAHPLDISIIEPGIKPGRGLALVLGIPLAAGLFIGFGLGIGLITLFTIIDDRVRTPGDVTGVTGSTPLLQTQHLTPAQLDFNYEQLPLPQVQTATSALLNRLDINHSDTPNNTCPIVLLASASSNEGKSLFALQLIADAAQNGNIKTLLIDGEFQTPTLTHTLEKENRDGFFNILQKKTSFEQTICSQLYPNVDFLPCGKIDKSIRLSLFKDTLHSLFKELRAKYDLIILEGTGLSTGPETLVFSKLCDETIFMVREGITEIKTLKTEWNQLLSLEILPSSVVLNDVQTELKTPGTLFEEAWQATSRKSKDLYLQARNRSSRSSSNSKSNSS